jgi:UDP-N-acetyl-D-mannosaminuronate dehydrogenase
LRGAGRQFWTSPALRVIDILHRRGRERDVPGSCSDAIPTSAGRSTRVSASDRAPMNADCIALLTPHSAYGLDWLASRPSLISEARDAFGSHRLANPIPQ